MQKVAPFDYHTPTTNIADKNGMEIGVGASVKLKGGEIAVVSSIDLVSQELRVETLPKDGSGKIRIVKAKSVELGEYEPQFDTAISNEMDSMGEVLLKGVWSGSHGGHDPEAKGKIKYIVRSFGKWARGKQSVAAKKLLERGVVKTPEAANRLAAWLKDQWMGTTKWRGDGKGLNKEDGDHGESIKPDAIDMLFKFSCEESGMDSEEMTVVISEAGDELESLLDELFGEGDHGGEQVSEPGDVEKSSERTSNNEDFLAAMSALQIGLADAIENEDLTKKEDHLASVLEDFEDWLGAYVSSGHYFDYESELAKTFDAAQLLSTSNKGVTLKDRLNNKPKSIEVADMEKMENLKGATVQDSSGRKWIVTAHEGDTLSVISGQERSQMPAADVKVVRQPMMGKAEGDMGVDEYGAPKKRKRLPFPPKRPAPEMGGAPKPSAPETDEAPKPPAPEMGGAPKPPAPEMGGAPKPPFGGAPKPEGGAPEGGGEEGAGSRLARLLAAARKRRAEAGGGAPAGPDDMGKAEMAKSAAPLTAAKIDRLRETRNFLESVLNYEAEEAEGAEEVEDTYDAPEAVAAPDVEDTFEETVSEVEASDADFNENTEVEKDVDEMSDSEISMDQIVEAINGLGDEVDSILSRVEEFSTLGSKLDHIGDLAKSLDSTERMDVLEQAVEKLTEVLGTFADSVETTVSLEKRLVALEIQPGGQTAASVDLGDHVIEKSAPQEALFQRTWGSIF